MNQDCYSLSQVINLTKQYTGHSNGKTLTATLPKGKWKLLRMGHTATGHTNATAGGGKGVLEAVCFITEYHLLTGGLPVLGNDGGQFF